MLFSFFLFLLYIVLGCFVIVLWELFVFVSLVLLLYCLSVFFLVFLTRRLRVGTELGVWGGRDGNDLLTKLENLYY